MNDYVKRIHLKTSGQDRQKLIDFCLKDENDQKLAIGWSSCYDAEHKSYDEFYVSVKKKYARINHVLNAFRDAQEDDLFWTRDLEGFYWICRVKKKAETCHNKDLKDLDIGAVLPVEAYKVSMRVPGQIKASFNRPNSSTCETIKSEDGRILEYSKWIFNKKRKEKGKTDRYTVNKENTDGDFLSNLPDFDLEELVICYLQLEMNYFVLSNSIARKSTTVNIECELVKRNDGNQKAVVQVKAGEKTINAEEYREYAKAGYVVYFYVHNEKQVIGLDEPTQMKIITKEALSKFYKKNKALLPENITQWENLFQ